MRDVVIVPVGDIDSAVGSDCHIDRTKPDVSASDEVTRRARGECRSARFDGCPSAGTVAGVRTDTGAIEAIRKCPSLIDDRSTGEAVSDVAMMEYRLEIAVRMRIMERAMLAEAFDEIRSLNVVLEWFRCIAGGEQVAESIEFDAPGIAAPFGEQLKSIPARMKAPDALLKAYAANKGGDRAPLGAVQPAVWPPRQRVGEGVCVFHAEASQQDLGRPVRMIVAVAIGVEQKIGRLRHEHAAISQRHPRRQIEVRQEIFHEVGATVAIGVLVDRDPVFAFGAAGRRFGELIVFRAKVLVDRRGLEPDRVGILPILEHPHTTPVVKTDRERLSDLRLRGNQFDFQAVGDFELFEFFFGRKRRRMIGQPINALGSRVNRRDE